MRVPASKGQGGAEEVVTIGSSTRLSGVTAHWHAHDTAEYARRSVAYMVREMALHEVDESIIINGRLYRDPHAPIPHVVMVGHHD
jgi:hypothetical protein